MKILTKNNQTLLFILMAFTFSVLVRLIWVVQFSEVEQFKFNNEFMINTNDGYFWAEGARDIVAGITTPTNDLSPIKRSASNLTAFLVNLLPFSFESIIFYMPIFFSSLVVIPIILIGKSIDRLEVGFISALLGSIAWSYYNRTMVGYYDTDFLNIVFPTFLLWSLIWAIKTQEDKYLIFTSLTIMTYSWWYPQSYSLEFAFFAIITAYIIYQYIKKQDYKYNLILLTFMMFSMMGIDSYIKFSIIIALVIFLKQNRKLFVKYIYYLFAFSLLLFMLSGGIDPILYQLKGYVFKSQISSTKEILPLHFFSVSQTIREAGQIPFEMFANRISGHTITFILSVVGYIWLSVKHPVMLLGIPMVGLGFLALSSGLRFTIYAVPVLAMGIAFFIYQVSKFLSKQLINNKASNISYYTLLTVFTIMVLYPNIKHIEEYKVPPVFTKNEVIILDKLKKIASREDYVVGWWDYGYPIRYYGDVKTLSDGGKHIGSVNFPTSFILTHPQKEASKMLRLDVEYTEKRFQIEKDAMSKWQTSNIGQMVLDFGYNDTNLFLDALKTDDLKLPNKTRDIYLYLPSRMLNIYPTVTLFSNLNLMNGEKSKQPFFYTSTRFKDENNFIDLSHGIKINKKSGELIIGNQKVRLKRFTRTVYDKKGKLQKQVQDIDLNGDLNVIYMSNYNKFLIVDNTVYNSLYFQLFVLEEYDKELFEPMMLTPLAKVYKLKI